MPEEKTVQKLKTEIEKSILLDETEKQYWLDILDKLPDVILEGMYKTIKAKNDLMQTYISTALKNDPDHEYLNQLKTKIKKIKNTALQISEKEQSVDAESLLVEKLANL